MKNLLLTYIILLLQIGLFAQSSSKNTSAVWLYFNDSNNHQNRNNQDLKTLLHLGQDDELNPIKHLRGSNLTHTKHQQIHKGIPVVGGMLITHEKKGKLHSANGFLLRNLSINTVPSISEEAARDIAINHIGAELYAWQSKDAEQMLKIIRKDSTTSFFPEGELVIVSPDLVSNTAQLSYAFEIYALKPHRQVKLFLNAHSGEIISETNMMHHADSLGNGNGNTTYNDNKNITSDYDSLTQKFHLKEMIRNIETRSRTPLSYSIPSNSLNPTGYSYENDTSDWEDQDTDAIQVHWASEQWYDYFLNKHNQNSYDNQGGKILNIVHFGQEMDNAFWNGVWASYGDGDGIKYGSWTSIDIVAHELTHSLIQHTAHLAHEGESGALSESFADIFGIMVERYALDSFNWTIGEDITLDSTVIRDFTIPMIYLDTTTNWDDGDHADIHNNSGVQSHWFYLLSNEIGIDNAADICFHSLKYYLTRHSTYTDAKNASIAAALELFGQDTATIVCSIWNQVGLGDCPNADTITINKPLVGEILTIGNPVDITWEASGNVNYVHIGYEIDHNGTWITIANNIPDSTGTYTWLVPELDTSSYITIKVSNATNQSAMDTVHLLSIAECPVIAEFIGDNPICLGEELSYINTSQNPGGCEWFLNDELISTEDTLHWIADSPGLFTITLNAYDTSGCYNAYSEQISVADSTNTAATFSYQQESETFTFSASYNDPYATYNWNFGNQNTGHGQQVSHTYTSGDLYTICLTVVNDCGTFEHCEHIPVSIPSGEGGFCQQKWTQHTNSQETTALLEIGDYIWIGTFAGGLIRQSKIDGSTEFFNNANSDLPDNRITSLAKDGTNNLWVGTHSEGVVKFDGTNWNTYHTSNSSLPHNYIKTLLWNANDTTIWIGTDGGGLSIFDGASDWKTHTSSNSGLPSNKITSLLKDTNGNVWIGTYNNGIAKFTGGNWNDLLNWEFFNNSNVDSLNNQITALLEGDTGDIWIGTYAKGIAKFNEQSGWEFFNNSTVGIMNNRTTSLVKDTSGNIWAGTFSGGVFKYDTAWDFYNDHNSNLPTNRVQSLLVDTNGDIWAGTRKGLVRFNGTDWDNSNIPYSGLFHNQITTFLITQDGTRWIGASGLGIVKFDSAGWDTLDVSNSALPDNRVYSLLEDQHGNVWIGTGAGLVKIDETNPDTIIFNTSSGLPHNHIRVLLEDSLGNIWVGTDGGGVAMYDGTSWTTFNTSTPNFNNDHIRALLEDSLGHIWVGTNGGGVIKYDGAGWSNPISDLSTDTIWVLLEDSAGKIWIGTEGKGLYKLNGDTLETNINTGLSSSTIRTLLEDSAGNIWVGTNGDGVAKYDGLDWTSFNSSNSGLPHNLVFTLSEDQNGDIWYGTYRGIGVFHSSVNFEADISCSQDISLFLNKSYESVQNEWRINGETVSYDMDLSYLFETSGTYEVSLISTNADGCTDIYTESITIAVSAPELNSILPEYISICNTDSISIDLSQYNYTSFEWTDNQGTLLDSTSTFTVTQTDTIHLSVTDSCGGFAYHSIIILLGTDCVWPGDANKDGITNHFDLLPIGITFGYTGPARLGMNEDWIGQAAMAWDSSYCENIINYKHADTNGDSIINQADKNAIEINYGKTNSSFSPNQESPSPIDALYSIVPVVKGIDEETNTLKISLELRSNEELLPPIYGMALTVEYDSPYGFDTLPRPMILPPEIIGEDTISIIRQFPFRTEIAFTRTNHQNISLNALYSGISIINYVLGDEAELAGGVSLLYLRIIPKEIILLDNLGDTIPVKGQELNVYLPNEEFDFIVTTTPVTCDSVGSATIIPLNNSDSYSYRWSTEDTTKTLLSPSVDTYTITVSDANGSIIWVDSINIEGTKGLDVTIEKHNKVLTADINNGDGNYTYDWSTGETTDSISIPSGPDVKEVSVTVSDENGCKGESTYVIKHIYVDSTATGTNDGSSWENAFTDLQDALADGADASIHIAEGTYYPTSGNQRDASFDIPDNCEIYGNYPKGGGIANDSLETTLSGDINQDGSISNNSYHVVKIKGVDSTINVLMNGLTIRDGNANDTTFEKTRGGGIYVNNANVELSNVIVKYNEAVYGGGGMFVTRSNHTSISNSIFRNNTADYGSAIFHSNKTNIYISKSRITNNDARVRAAIEMKNSLYSRIENSVIADNISKNANAISCIATNRNGNAEIINCTILGGTKDRQLITMHIGHGDTLDLLINNSIVAHHSPDFDKAFNSYNNGHLNLTTNNCYIQGSSSSVLGIQSNNLYSDIDGPLTFNSDYSLAPTSIGVDSGSNSLTTDSTDIKGNVRITNYIVDLGAYEVVAPDVNPRIPFPIISDIIVSPNPTEGELFIITEMKNLNFQLYDLLGKRVMNTGSKELDIYHLPDGFYILKITQDEILVNSRKIVKK